MTQKQLLQKQSQELAQAIIQSSLSPEDIHDVICYLMEELATSYRSPVQIVDLENILKEIKRKKS